MIRLTESNFDIRHISTIDELTEILESGEYAYYGLRGATKHDINSARLNGYLGKSHNWIDGTRTDEVLDGTCAIYVGDFLSEAEIVHRYNLTKKYLYSTSTILLIAGDEADYGEDEHEVIISDDGYGADVIAVVDSLSK